MKIVKTVFNVLFWIVAAAIAAVIVLPLWIGPVVRCAANSAVPKITKTGFNLGEFGFNQYSGRLHVGDMRLENPERFFTDSEKSAKPLSEVKGDGILGTALAHAGNAVAAVGDSVAAVGDALASSETNAVSLKALDVRFSTLSALTDTVKIDEIVVDGLYFYGDLTFSNIREIADNAAGGDRDGEKAGKPAEEKPAEEDKSGGEEKGEPEKKGGKKVQIGRVFITGAKIQWGHVAVPLPDIEIKDIGKEEGGADEESAMKTVVDGFCDAADKVCAGAGTALKVALEGADAAKNAVGGAIDAAGGVLDGATDAGKNAVDSATETVGAGVDAVKKLFN